MITPPRYSSGWESGCGPADKNLSNINTTAYSGTGYGTNPRGTIGVGNAGTTPDMPDPVQVRFFKGSDGNLYVMDNDGVTYKVTAGGSIQVIPPYYTPTK